MRWFRGVAKRYKEWKGKRFCNIMEKVCAVDKGLCNGTEHVLQWEERYSIVKQKMICTGMEKMFCNKTENVLQWNGKCWKGVCNEMGMVFVVLRIK